MKKNGFTLIEVLLVTFLLGVVVISGGSLFFSILKGASKAELEKEVRQNGDYAVSIMERMIRSAQKIKVGSCDSPSSSLIIQNPDGGETEFSCVPDEEVTKIASGSGAGRIGMLTGNSVTLGSTCPSDIFTCDKTRAQPKVTISFTLYQKGTGPRPEEKAQIRFQTTVNLRTY